MHGHIDVEFFLGYSEDTRDRREQPLFERISNLRLFLFKPPQTVHAVPMRPLPSGGHHYKIKITYRNKIISSTSFQLVIKLN